MLFLQLENFQMQFFSHKPYGRKTAEKKKKEVDDKRPEY